MFQIGVLCRDDERSCGVVGILGLLEGALNHHLRTEAVDGIITIDERSIEKKDINENTLIQLSVPILTQKLDDNFTTKGIIPIVDDEIYIATLENMGIENYIIIKSESQQQ